ncbi:3-beta-hydroxycholanate 3-dehydrogenase (NADP(+)) [BD1-7 clade bacterium]|uniref:3-beta-hydroxycholanate 3-dehydrogenase (NADP(+)) n=1 Tax=BD1-7 clade bacterium TaxID=2029982 RepID=A0A5S9N3B2_9GAMM|nr:3-beta-hydroxycholanate 3-dehydrogenase (NADP(+)) [BD1-7 clade bacterium]
MTIVESSENDLNAVGQPAQRTVVVTGASRGAGKGIALALAQPGTTIYVTGRTSRLGEASLPGTVFETVRLIEERGGKGVAVVCDHGDDEQVRQLFEQVERESGSLDILVNNACAVPEALTDALPFWEKSLRQLDILDVGMRSHYVSSYFAAPLLVKQSGSLIVHTSSAGGRCYMHGPAYGGGKAAVDKFANDMAVDFRAHGVACVSLWMGLMSTERTQALMAQEPEKYGGMEAMCESPEFPGRVIDALWCDHQLMEKSGLILVAAQQALEYGITDVDGSQPSSPTGYLGEPAQANPAIVE